MWDLIQENLYFVWYEYKNIKEAVVQCGRPTKDQVVLITWSPISPTQNLSLTIPMTKPPPTFLETPPLTSLPPSLLPHRHHLSTTTHLASWLAPLSYFYPVRKKNTKEIVKNVVVRKKRGVQFLCGAQDGSLEKVPRGFHAEEVVVKIIGEREEEGCTWVVLGSRKSCDHMCSLFPLFCMEPIPQVIIIQGLLTIIYIILRFSISLHSG